MTVTLSLNPEVEKGLLARAHERGMSLDDYLQDVVTRAVTREAGVSSGADHHPGNERFGNLSDLLLHSPFAGADLDLSRLADLRRSA